MPSFRCQDSRYQAQSSSDPLLTLGAHSRDQRGKDGKGLKKGRKVGGRGIGGCGRGTALKRKRRNEGCTYDKRLRRKGGRAEEY